MIKKEININVLEFIAFVAKQVSKMLNKLAVMELPILLFY